MEFSTAKNERLIATASVLVAVLMLVVGVTAQQSKTVPKDNLVQLESDLRFQLEMAFRHDPHERADRLKQLEQTTTAWRKSPRSEADHKLLADWLLEATVRSMPGSNEPLPPIPTFGLNQQEQTATTAPGNRSQPKSSVVKTQPIPTASTTDSDSFKQIPQLRPKVTVSTAPDVFPHALEIVNNLPPMPIVEHSAKKPALEAMLDEAISPETQPEHPAGRESIETAPSTPLVEELFRSVQDEAATNSAATASASEPSASNEHPAKLVQKPEKSAPPIKINLNELAARIAGYHKGLQRVETMLLTLDKPDLTVIARQIHLLDEMTKDFHFVSLYYEALSEREKQGVLQPRSMTATLEEIERLLKRSESEESDDFLDEFDAQKQTRITRLRRQLKEIADRVKN